MGEHVLEPTCLHNVGSMTTPCLSCSHVTGCGLQQEVLAGLCLRFADDFEVSLDDWKPDPTDSSTTNLCVVSEGTYEICSRTIAAQAGSE